VGWQTGVRTKWGGENTTLFCNHGKEDHEHYGERNWEGRGAKNKKEKKKKKKKRKGKSCWDLLEMDKMWSLGAWDAVKRCERTGEHVNREGIKECPEGGTLEESKGGETRLGSVRWMFLRGRGENMGL